MDYALFTPPCSLDFDRLSKRELRNYFEWFLGVIPERMAELRRFVNASAGFQEWDGDLSVGSLEVLAHWFVQKVETRMRSSMEMKEIESGATYNVGASDRELTEQTFSLAVDVAIHLSEVLRKGHPSLRWDQELQKKRSMDYGHPLLREFSWGPLNPVRICVTWAYAISQGKQGSGRLPELYEVWSEKAL